VLSYAIIFLVIAMIIGVLGFGAIVGTAAMLAKVLFLAFLVLLVCSLLSDRKTNV
jgi:uncharacterized membrane protein YtjA (UPF0391 family)